MNKSFNKYLASLKVKSTKQISLKKDFETAYSGKQFTKEESEILLGEGVKNLNRLQDKLYADQNHSILIIFQALDAGGKDGAIKHVMSGLNPQGVRVTSFKAPSKTELAHDYFWRHSKELPARGELGIFNRSYYENVLITRVHPEMILEESIPGIKKVGDVKDAFWNGRYKQIRRFEKNLVENGTLVLKFFLYLSKSEQKKRFIERIDNPAKNWKFSLADIEERKFWKEYTHAYEELLEKTSTPEAPWYVIPADDKWFTRLCLSNIIHEAFEKLNLAYPVLNKSQGADLQKAREELMNEGS